VEKRNNWTAKAVGNVCVCLPHPLWFEFHRMYVCAAPTGNPKRFFIECSIALMPPWPSSMRFLFFILLKEFLCAPTQVAGQGLRCNNASLVLSYPIGLKKPNTCGPWSVVLFFGSFRSIETWFALVKKSSPKFVLSRPFGRPSWTTAELPGIELNVWSSSTRMTPASFLIGLIRSGVVV
jgi:hypothetical protein